MMTFQEWAEDYLKKCGFLADAPRAEVLNAVKELQPTMVGRWDEQIEDYPPVMQIGIRWVMNDCANQWIENKYPLGEQAPQKGGA